MKISQLFLIGTVALLACGCQGDYFSSWPAESSPKTIGNLVANRFLGSPHGIYGYGTNPHIPYFEVCTWHGALTFAELTADDSLMQSLVDRFEPLFDAESHLRPAPVHVDYNVFGTIPLEIFLQTKDQKYFDLGIPYAVTQWENPDDSVLSQSAADYLQKGYSWQTRLWIDDMYMITMIQTQAYRATGELDYLNRAANEMVFYLDNLQQQNGLFYHASSSPFFWSRGNGWMAAGMTELLRVLTPDNGNYDRIMNAYRKMMTTLLGYQTESGAWRQLIDNTEAWEESSGTGMFTYAMITGVKNGWLEEATFGPSARKGWLRLVRFINKEGDVKEVCEGTGAGNNTNYYLERKRNTGDFHGQAPILWCASALLRSK